MCFHRELYQSDQREICRFFHSLVTVFMDGASAALHFSFSYESFDKNYSSFTILLRIEISSFLSRYGNERETPRKMQQI